MPGLSSASGERGVALIRTLGSRPTPPRPLGGRGSRLHVGVTRHACCSRRRHDPDEPAPPERPGRRCACAERRLGLPDSIRACLFDLDGVLTQTANVHYGRLEAHLRRVPARPRPRGSRSSASPTTTATSTASPAPTASAASWPAGGSPCPRAAPTTRRTPRPCRASRPARTSWCCASSSEHGVEVYPGSVRYLRAVKDAGLATAVVTASANGEQVIAAGGFADLIDARVDGVVAGARRPARQAGARHLPGRRPGAGRRARRRRWSSRTRSPAWPPAGPGDFGFVVGVDRVGQADALARARRRRRRAGPGGAAGGAA